MFPVIRLGVRIFPGAYSYPRSPFDGGENMTGWKMHLTKW